MKINLLDYLDKKSIKLQVICALDEAQQEEFLKAVYNAHLRTFFYHNFALRKISRQHPVNRHHITLFDYETLLDETPGGYCFQSARLLAFILKELGFDVRFCEARVLNGTSPADSRAILPTHVVLRVVIDGAIYFLEPGLGAKAPRFPILVTGHDEIIEQGYDRYKFSQQQGYYLLEKQVKEQWTTLVMTDLKPLTDDKLAFNLLRLERHVLKLPIRDEIVVAGQITENGCKTFFFDTRIKKYAFAIEEKGAFTKTVYETTAAAYEQLMAEFAIEGLTKADLALYAKQSTLPRPKKPWTVDFPLDDHELKRMANNLRQ
ncbi:arylamine N-acetyltransferase [Legionella erythra]|uniref:Putative N-hydroxyarylamine O-acetyltransferase n=1 Tax=Legionella erythra TaxID=448 RepID=A0A0W0TEY1_LEGER|nr:arylamine N-acetyltransferase [Legionella erythra]KTC94151.1 putative N-hydroxyarylamine O-acetyltransferase [Legionella erythra]